MKERRKQERRRWGRKVTYPFIDSEGVLVTKNRRRKIDRRDVSDEPEETVEEVKEEDAPLAAAAAEATSAEKPKDNTSVEISESKVMELEDALQDSEEPSSNIMSSIKDLEDEILEATDESSQSSARLEVIAKKNSPAENIEAKASEETAPEKQQAEKSKEAKAPEETTPEKQQAEKDIPEKDQTPEVASAKVEDNDSSAELPEIDIAAIGGTNGKDKGISIELLVKGKKHIVTTDKSSCVLGRDPSCDIVIQSKFVSRAHAKIILKDGKFLVEDNSFNGTYINFSNGQKIHVAKDEQTLIANGSMSMGKPVDDDSKSVIEFKINQ